MVDKVVKADEISGAIESTASMLTGAGVAALLGNRRTLRVAREPLDRFRRYMSVYSYEQARCLYSPGLIANLERNWNAAQRRLASTPGDASDW